jgi:sarcosine/dimethylglycine N-methyltransferase
MTYDEKDLVASIEHLAGDRLTTLTQEQWNQLDQFHSGGADAVDRLLPGLHLAAGLVALDVGSGFGGPARQVARSTGCSVVGVDITPAYVDAANTVTRTAGLADRVSFFSGDIASFDHTAVDAAYTMHVQMNVADKLAFFTGIGRLLLPGAPFATFEVCRTGDIEPGLPLPWSMDGSDSFLVTPEELCDTIQASGFDVVEWVDESSWVRDWFADASRRVAAGGSRATLSALLTDGQARTRNFAAALKSGVVTIRRGAFTRAQ